MGHLAAHARIAGILSVCLLMLSAPAAMAFVPTYQPDAQIRQDSLLAGDNIYEADAAIQWIGAFGPHGAVIPFDILIENDGSASDSFKVSRSSGYTSGYRVRYYDAANNDVTGRVNVGSFTTPTLTPGAEYVMHATVKVRWFAAECSSTSRRITVRSVGDSTIKDAVRFTGGLDPMCPDLTLSPGQLNAVDSYSYDFAGQAAGATQTFTLKNEGSGPSEVLGFSTSGTGFAFSADTCTGGVLAAGGTCGFAMTFTPAACLAPLLMDIGVTGGVPPTIQYLELVLIASCPT